MRFKRIVLLIESKVQRVSENTVLFLSWVAFLYRIVATTLATYIVATALCILANVLYKLLTMVATMMYGNAPLAVINLYYKKKKQ